MDYKPDVVMDGENYKGRKSWTKEEDEILIQNIQAYGVGHWSTIAQALRDNETMPKSLDEHSGSCGEPIGVVSGRGAAYI